MVADVNSGMRKTICLACLVAVCGWDALWTSIKHAFILPSRAVSQHSLTRVSLSAVVTSDGAANQESEEDHCPQRRYALGVASVCAVLAVSMGRAARADASQDVRDDNPPPTLTKEALERASSKLDLATKYVAFFAGTEFAFTGKTVNGYAHDNKEAGVYASAISGAALFSSAAKYDSGTGWPSFWAPINSRTVLERVDPSDSWSRPDKPSTWRVEVLDRASMTHLGHVFPDGPPPTGKRYCLNTAVFKFNPGEAPAGVASEAAWSKALLSQLVPQQQDVPVQLQSGGDATDSDVRIT